MALDPRDLTDEDRANIERWHAAAHDVQSGIAVEMGQNIGHSTEPKHLRVGINCAMRDHGSVVELLVRKGVITRSEYLQPIADGMEEEQRQFETRLSEILGSKVTLG